MHILSFIVYIYVYIMCIYIYIYVYYICVYILTCYISSHVLSGQVAQVGALHCWLRAAFSALCRQMIQSPSQWLRRASARPELIRGITSPTLPECWNMLEQYGRVSNLVVSSNAGFWILHVEIENTSHSITCQLFVQDRRESLILGEGKVSEMYNLALSTLAQSILDICASTELGYMSSMGTFAKNLLPFVTCLQTSIFSCAPRTYLSTYRFTYQIVLWHCVAWLWLQYWHDTS